MHFHVVYAQKLLACAGVLQPLSSSCAATIKEDRGIVFNFVNWDSIKRFKHLTNKIIATSC